MNKNEKVQLQITACKVHMGVIEATHSAKAGHPGGSLSQLICSPTCTVLSEKLPLPVKRIGVNDEFGYSGPAAVLLKQFGLSAEHIIEVAKSFCN